MNRELAIRILVGDIIGTTEQTHKAVKMAVEALQDQKTGKWAYKTTDVYTQRTCSACGWSERMYHRNRNQDGLIRNYCPSCGCRMEGINDKLTQN